MKNYFHKYIVQCKKDGRYLHYNSHIPTDWGNGLETTTEENGIKMFCTRLKARLFICKMFQAYEILWERYKNNLYNLVSVPHDYKIIKNGFKIIRWRDTRYCSKWLEKCCIVNQYLSTTVSDATTLPFYAGHYDK